LERACSIVIELGDELGQDVQLEQLALIAVEQGDYESARALALRAVEYSARTGLKFHEAGIRNSYGFILLVNGDIVGAKEQFSIARKLVVGRGFRVPLLNATLGLAAVEQNLEQYGTLLDQAEELMEITGATIWEPMVLGLRALWTKDIALAERAVELARDMGYRIAQARFGLILDHLCPGKGHDERAVVVYRSTGIEPEAWLRGFLVHLGE
jgi:hypothetical protein